MRQGCISFIACIRQQEPRGQLSYAGNVRGGSVGVHIPPLRVRLVTAEAAKKHLMICENGRVAEKWLEYGHVWTGNLWPLSCHRHIRRGHFHLLVQNKNLMEIWNLLRVCCSCCHIDKGTMIWWWCNWMTLVWPHSYNIHKPFQPFYIHLNVTKYEYFFSEQIIYSELFRKLARASGWD